MESCCLIFVGDDIRIVFDELFILNELLSRFEKLAEYEDELALVVEFDGIRDLFEHSSV